MVSNPPHRLGGRVNLIESLEQPRLTRTRAQNSRMSWETSSAKYRQDQTHAGYEAHDQRWPRSVRHPIQTAAQQAARVVAPGVAEVRRGANYGRLARGGLARSSLLEAPRKGHAARQG